MVFICLCFFICSELTLGLNVSFNSDNIAQKGVSVNTFTSVKPSVF